MKKNADYQINLIVPPPIIVGIMMGTCIPPHPIPAIYQ